MWVNAVEKLVPSPYIAIAAQVAKPSVKMSYRIGIAGA
jgi:hypothetical protein